MASLGGKCIAIQLDGLTIVLQQRRLAGENLYRNTLLVL